MSKYYIKCGTLELIYSTDKSTVEAAVTSLFESNKFDTLDEYFYIDERGFRDYLTADKQTEVLKLNVIAKMGGWTLGND